MHRPEEMTARAQSRGQDGRNTGEQEHLCGEGPHRSIRLWGLSDTEPQILHFLFWQTFPLLCSYSVFPPFTFFLNLFYQARKLADLQCSGNLVTIIRNFHKMKKKKKRSPSLDSDGMNLGSATLYSGYFMSLGKIRDLLCFDSWL